MNACSVQAPPYRTGPQAAGPIAPRTGRTCSFAMHPHALQVTAKERLALSEDHR
jgi:hypothetical protein